MSHGTRSCVCDIRGGRDPAGRLRGGPDVLIPGTSSERRLVCGFKRFVTLRLAHEAQGFCHLGVSRRRDVHKLTRVSPHDLGPAEWKPDPERPY
jgi:hypothetical protein